MIESVSIFYEDHKDVLGNVLSDSVHAAAHARGETVNNPAPPPVERRERLFVTGQRQPEKLMIVSSVQIRHTRYHEYLMAAFAAGDRPLIPRLPYMIILFTPESSRKII